MEGFFKKKISNKKKDGRYVFNSPFFFTHLVGLVERATTNLLLYFDVQIMCLAYLDQFICFDKLENLKIMYETSSNI